MKYPMCDHKTDVIDSRAEGAVVKRSRRCQHCKSMYYTSETIGHRTLTAEAKRIFKEDK